MSTQNVMTTVHYSGDKILIMDRVPRGFGPGTIVRIDVNDSDTYSYQVTAGADGLFTISLDAPGIPFAESPSSLRSIPCNKEIGENAMLTPVSMYFCTPDGSRQSPPEHLIYIQDSPENLASSKPKNLVDPGLLFIDKGGEPIETPYKGEVPPEKLPIDPYPCVCTTCGEGETINAASLDIFAKSLTPTEQNVELATGKVRQYFHITGFETRKLGFNMGLHHTSLVDYNGPWGQGFSHSFNMMIVQTAELEGQIVTPDLRCFSISSKDGALWDLPCGFFSRLTLDQELQRWILTHFSGMKTVFYKGGLHAPGYPISIIEPNNNETKLRYDASGRLESIVTDLQQKQTFTFGSDGRLELFTDHIQRQWTIVHDAEGRLLQIKTPATSYADIPACTEITEKELKNVVKFKSRVWTLGYTDDASPNHIRSVTDPRGEIPKAFDYDSFGRARIAWINNKAIHYLYQGGNPDFSFPVSITTLEDTNLCTVVTDREGNMMLYEIHGPLGGSLNDDGHFYDEFGRYLDGKGRFGLRRMVHLTETGKGNGSLRPDEPQFWEQRWLHDCDCLSPIAASETFRNDQKDIIFDEYGIPVNYPINKFTYNANKQIIRQERTNGTDSIITISSYQEYSFGDHQQYSRHLSRTDPRGFDNTPVYAGLSFEHKYKYDPFGNRISHESPIVTRGVDTTQTVLDTWTYNQFGQILVHTDPNCNLTVNTYFDGTGSEGDINTRGKFGGYLQSVTRGAKGSYDPVTNLTTFFKVNPLGMVTQTIDPNGFIYDTKYNDLQETIRDTDAGVTLRNGQYVRYETRHIYDGAGNEVVHRRSNIDLDGTCPVNDFIDRTYSFDAVNNLLSEQVEVDEKEVNNLITRYAYDNNDDMTVTRKPEGNREFRIYDERRLPFKIFSGVSPMPGIELRKKSRSGPFIETKYSQILTEDYPSDKRSMDLGDTSFISLEISTYDARKNMVIFQDGRGNVSLGFFDFNDRQIAFSDPNGNGWTRLFDDASNVITESGGAVSRTTGQIVKALERSYMRFDEIGRQYQKVLDIGLDTDESQQIDPDEGKNSSYLMVFDAGSRIVRSIDANGNTNTSEFDAADREIIMNDALKNQRLNIYDQNSNIIKITEIEVPGPGTTGALETYVTTYVFDELNRHTEQHILGLNGNSIDHAWYFAYDSRNNQRLEQDTEGNFELTTFDDHDRQIMMQRFNGDPITETPTELLHYEWGYDRNDNNIEERALSDVNDPQSIQITRNAFDDLDRRVRIVYPDSDDPIDGGSNGPDGIFDRVELTYDPNSNPIQVTDQREVVFKTRFDPGNRPERQDITLPPDVPGTTWQSYTYDAIDRTVRAKNNYAKIDMVYDAFSRLVLETQSISLDGSGKDFEQPIKLVNAYDKQSNRTDYQVLDGRKKNLDIAHTYDALNRVTRISAAYYKRPMQTICKYSYIGPFRVINKRLGNGAQLRYLYDEKRRIGAYQWNGPQRLLAAFEYGYDRMDNALFERFVHDQGLYDHFRYNDRYEVTGVSYRIPGLIPPAMPTDSYSYDDLFNRRQANFSRPFDKKATTLDSYAVNKANEYTRLTRNGKATDPAHDRAGNATNFMVLPVFRNPKRHEVMARAHWDAFNLLFDIEPGGINPQQDYRYDPLRRRIVTLEPDDENIGQGSKRYIYDGWSVVEERLFIRDATLSKSPSTLERIYVNGIQIDEPILTAIDGNQDGSIGESNVKNVPESSADQEYYYLNNRLGSIMALLDADNADRVLEYYRYTIYGEPTVLPVVDEDGDGLEDTPLDLSDNSKIAL